MFDAKTLLESIMRGAGEPPRQQAPGAAGASATGGGLGDILGQLGSILGQPQGQGAGGAPAGAGQGGGLEDMLRRLGTSQNVAPDEPSTPPSQPGGRAVPAGGGDSGGFGDILGQLQKQLGGKGGGLMDVLGQVLAQAGQGVREGAQRADQATGASGHARDVISKTTGMNPEDIFAQVKDLIEKNQMGAGAAAGGLGAVLLGTKAGRSLTAGALKVGGLALIGGLAYKALQNYQQGKPLVTGAQQLSLAEAPQGFGFEANAISNDGALLLIRGMIAAAAADGRIDEKEQKRILGDLEQAGQGSHAEEFLANELNNPATVEDLAGAVTSPEQAVQLFTAARVAIDLDNDEEHDFLVALATALSLDDDLVNHIDAAARAAA